MSTTIGFLLGAAALLHHVRNHRQQSVLRLGTRKSDLAMVQTRYVAKMLEQNNPGLKVEIIEPIKAYGDKQLDQSLKTLAAKTPGLFTKDLEQGLTSGLYDAAVHSLKDVPTTLPDGLLIAGITEREDPRDALVVRADYKGQGGLTALPEGAVVGTSSVRREAMLLREFAHLNIKVIRGNVNTRLKKLDDGEYDAIVLAVAGLKRLGVEFEERIEQYLEPPSFMYGVGQGALGLQCRVNDPRTIQLLQSIEHAETAARCKAERSLLKKLEGGCQVPLGVHSEVTADALRLSATVLSEDGKASIQASLCGGVCEPEKLGCELAEKLLKDGAQEMLNAMKSYAVEDVSKRPLTYGSAEAPNLGARNNAGN